MKPEAVLLAFNSLLKKACRVRINIRLAPVLMLLASLVMMPALVLAQNYATVFVYHRFGDTRYPSTNISIEKFEDHLRYLRDNNYNVVLLSEIVARLRRGEDLPPRCVALSADDAYASVLTGALPLLDKYAVPMTLFVNTAAVGGNSYMSWDQLRLLDARDNIEIGNHSAHHPYYVSIPAHAGPEWEQLVRKDLQESQQAFEEHIGYIPKLFAYPYGEYSPELMRIIEDMGFSAAFSQQSGPIGEQTPAYALPRFPMGGAYVDMARLRSNLHMHPLDIQIISPDTPLLQPENDPPELTFKIKTPDISISTFKCYVQGQGPVELRSVSGKEGAYRVQAQSPLQGRRSKYTITGQDRHGRWYWFSQLWIHP